MNLIIILNINILSEMINIKLINNSIFHDGKVEYVGLWH